MKPVPGAKKVGEPLFLRCTLLWNNQHNQDHTFLTPKCVLVPLVNCSIMPTSPLPQKTTALQVIWQFLVLYISAVTQCALCFLVWLLSLSIIILRSIHVVVYMNHCWLVFHCMLLSTFIYPFTCWWHLHCFQSFGIANKAAMNVCVCVGVCVCTLELKKMGTSALFERHCLENKNTNHLLKESICKLHVCKGLVSKKKYIYIYSISKNWWE